MANLRIQKLSEAQNLACFDAILDALVERVYTHEPIVLGVAYSGGLDSTALLHLTRAYALKKKVGLVAFHIHHGLQPRADAWLCHCQQTCETWNIPFSTKRVLLQTPLKDGTEGAARKARYLALNHLSEAYPLMKLLLTAHHENDQAETVFMQFMRGAGVKGLSGMDVLGRFPETNTTRLLGRPLLYFSRDTLVNYVHEQGLSWVQDDSNDDTRYARNAIRHHVLPEISLFFPKVERAFVRCAANMQATLRILESIAKEDLELCQEQAGLSLSKMIALGEDRFDNLFRYWLSANHLRMPSVAWLANAKNQLFSAKDDAQVRIDYEGMTIYRYRDYLLMAPQQKRPDPTVTFSFKWTGEKRYQLESFRGNLVFKEVNNGLDRNWLLNQELEVRTYNGQAKLKVDLHRKTRTLKLHYQERGISAFKRARYPFLYVKNDLLFAPEIGLAAQYVKKGDQGIAIYWES